jgi:hypothetical protein
MSLLTHMGIQQFADAFLNEHCQHLSVFVNITVLSLMIIVGSCLSLGIPLMTDLANAADGCLL